MKSHNSPSPTPRRVRDLLEAQLRDAGSMARVHRAAGAAARVPRGSLIARELVADVVGETFAGTLAWDLDRVPLATHLIEKVRQRARRHRREQAASASLEALRESEMPHGVEPPSISDERGPEVDLAEFLQRLDELRFRARGHRDALKLLALYERGKVRRRDARQLGMSVSEYRAARGLLMRLAAEVWSAIPKTQNRSDSEATPTQAARDVSRSPEAGSAVGLLLAATRLGPRRAEPSAPTELLARSGT